MELSLKKMGRIVNEMVAFGKRLKDEHLDLIYESLKVFKKRRRDMIMFASQSLERKDYKEVLVIINFSENEDYVAIWRLNKKNGKAKCVGHSTLVEIVKTPGVAEMGKKLGIPNNSKKLTDEEIKKRTVFDVLGRGKKDDKYSYLLPIAEKQINIKHDGGKYEGFVATKQGTENEETVCVKIENNKKIFFVVYSMSGVNDYKFEFIHEALAFDHQ